MIHFFKKLKKDSKKEGHYIFHDDRALPRTPIPVLDARQPLAGIHLQHLPRQREERLVDLDVLVGNLLDLERDPDPLPEGAEGVPEEGQIGGLGVSAGGSGCEA